MSDCKLPAINVSIDPEFVKTIRENERMKIALQLIMSHAENSIVGGWRQKVYNIAKRGLEG